MEATRHAGAGASSIDEYIAAFPADVQAKLQSVRRAIHEAAPGAEEAIKYGLPTFVLHGNLVHFGGFKNHIGFYNGATAVVEAFQDQLAPYKQSKGTVRFSLDKPLPLDLIRRMVETRAKENAANAESKRKR